MKMEKFCRPTLGEEDAKENFSPNKAAVLVVKQGSIKEEKNQSIRRNHRKLINHPSVQQSHFNEGKPSSRKRSTKTEDNKNIKTNNQKLLNRSSVQQGHLNVGEPFTQKDKYGDSKNDGTTNIKTKIQELPNGSSALHVQPDEQPLTTASNRSIKEEKNQSIKRNHRKLINHPSVQQSHFNEGKPSSRKRSTKTEDNKNIKTNNQKLLNRSSVQQGHLNAGEPFTQKDKYGDSKNDGTTNIKTKIQELPNGSSALHVQPDEQPLTTASNRSIKEEKNQSVKRNHRKLINHPSVQQSHFNEGKPSSRKRSGKLASGKISGKKRKQTTESEDVPTNKKSKVAPEEVYEVESIVGHDCVKGVHFYEVKWRGWASNSNTWEPSEHLDNCEGAILTYLVDTNENIQLNNKDFETLKTELTNFEKSYLNKALNEYVSPDGIVIPPPDAKTQAYIESVSKIPCELRDPKVMKIVREKVLHAELCRLREEQLEAMQAWESRINKIILNNNGTSYLKLENNVDLEVPPENFTYVNEYVPGEGVIIPDDPPIGCSCGPHCTARRNRKCCFHLHNEKIFAYSHKKLLKVPLGGPVYECNKKCKCGPECDNRVVQNGRKFSLCIFRTTNERGWGVKALENIPKGSFVTVYVGELITTEEGDRRGIIYDEQNQTYLFDLDFNYKRVAKYCVDATIMGNESHFINHSCDPNMHVFSVYDNCLDPDIPNLAFFSIKDIAIGQELLIDYLNEPNYLKEQNKEPFVNPNPHNENMICKCGSKLCRQYYL